MWNPGRPAAEQCEGCTFYTNQVAELSYLHSRDITYAVFSQGRNVAMGFAEPQASYEESLRYRDFMGWDMPWYSAQPSLDALLVGREIGLFHLVCYLRRRRPRLRDLLDQTPRRGGDGLQLRAHGSHRVRTPGAVGGFASRLATTVLQRADRWRCARLATGDRVAGRTPDRPVAATRSRTLRRPRNRCALSGPRPARQSDTRVTTGRNGRDRFNPPRPVDPAVLALWNPTVVEPVADAADHLRAIPATSSGCGSSPATRCVPRLHRPIGRRYADPAGFLMPAEHWHANRDELAPGSLQRSAALLERAPRAAGVIGRSTVDEHGRYRRGRTPSRAFLAASLRAPRLASLRWLRVPSVDHHDRPTHSAVRDSGAFPDAHSGP